jgi:hypothetical protein
MQNDGKLSSNGNLGFAQATSLGEPDTPGFECRPFCYTGEQHIGCLVEITSQHVIAAFRDSAGPVDLAGCVSPGCKPNIGSDNSRFSEPRGGGPDEFDRAPKGETERVAKVVKSAEIRLG